MTSSARLKHELNAKKHSMQNFKRNRIKSTNEKWQIYEQIPEPVHLGASRESAILY